MMIGPLFAALATIPLTTVPSSAAQQAQAIILTAPTQVSAVPGWHPVLGPLAGCAQHQCQLSAASKGLDPLLFLHMHPTEIVNTLASHFEADPDIQFAALWVASGGVNLQWNSDYIFFSMRYPGPARPHR
jgi:hypothetical protein